MSKTIVPILSGGLDSSTMLWYLNKEGYTISEVISFSYGQKHSREIQSAYKIVQEFSNRFYPISHQVLDITNVGKLIATGSLTGEDKIPHEMYDSENQRSTIVPNRNMIFLSIAAGRAITIHSDHIGYAAHASDYSVYPDCRPEFIEQMDKALYEGNLWQPVKLVAPFQHLNKDDIVKIGIDLEVPYELTWSCYEGQSEPCLKCGTCVERTEAFLSNNYPDPALHKDKWKFAVNILNEYKTSQ